MEECCVCYNDFDNEAFRIGCSHHLCRECYFKIKNRLCPLCRKKMSFQIKTKRKQTPKGKLNLKKYEKIKTHIKYRHNIFVVGEKRINSVRKNNMLILRDAYKYFGCN